MLGSTLDVSTVPNIKGTTLPSLATPQDRQLAAPQLILLLIKAFSLKVAFKFTKTSQHQPISLKNRKVSFILKGIYLTILSNCGILTLHFFNLKVSPFTRIPSRINDLQNSTSLASPRGFVATRRVVVNPPPQRDSPYPWCLTRRAHPLPYSPQNGNRRRHR